MRHLLLLIWSSIRASSNTLPPPPCRPLCLEEEVANDKEGNVDDNDNDNAATAVDGDKNMPPKAKCVTTHWSGTCNNSLEKLVKRMKIQVGLKIMILF